MFLYVVCRCALTVIDMTDLSGLVLIRRTPIGLLKFLMLCRLSDSHLAYKDNHGAEQ